MKSDYAAWLGIQSTIPNRKLGASVDTYAIIVFGKDSTSEGIFYLLSFGRSGLRPSLAQGLRPRLAPTPAFPVKGPVGAGLVPALCPSNSRNTISPTVAAHSTPDPFAPKLRCTQSGGLAGSAYTASGVTVPLAPYTGDQLHDKRGKGSATVVGHVELKQGILWRFVGGRRVSPSSM